MTNSIRCGALCLGFTSITILCSAAAQSLQGHSNLAQSTRTAAGDDNLACTISATDRAWNPPGTMDVAIDGADVGSFDFGPNGSKSLDFSCTEGKHSFTFTVEGTNISCSATFRVSKSKTKFVPGMFVSPNGTTSCGLQ
jgi:hypothetical protein